MERLEDKPAGNPTNRRARNQAAGESKPPGKCEDCGAPVMGSYKRCYDCNQAAGSNAA